MAADLSTGTDTSNWIVSTSLDKPDASTRRAIRRHVMRNKNTRECRQTAQHKQLMQDYDKQWATRRSRWNNKHSHGDIEWVPRPMGQVTTDLAFFDLGFELKPYMLELIYRAFTIIKPSAYTMERALVGKENDSLLCFDGLAQSPAMAHAVMHTAQSFHDSSVGAPMSSTAQYHLVQTLRHLQTALGSGTDSRTDMTMVVVVSLATAAALMGDLNGVVMHMNGLHRMVALRGGLASLGPGSMILQKAQRLDFGIALATGCKTRFLRGDVPWGPSIALDCATGCPELAALRPIPDDRLLAVWADLREFSRVANQATRTGVKMSPGFFSLLGDTVPYRLLSLQYEVGSCAELLRLCMLAYAKSLLVQIPSLGKNLVYLHTSLKTALLAQSRDPETGPFLLWALFVAATAIFEDFDRDWIRDMMAHVAKQLPMRNWDETRAILKRFLWTDLVYEQGGKRLFEEWLVPS